MFRPDTILGDMLSGDMVLGPRYVLRFQFLVQVPSWSRRISRVEMDCRSLVRSSPEKLSEGDTECSEVYFRRFFWVMVHLFSGLLRTWSVTCRIASLSLRTLSSSSMRGSTSWKTRMLSSMTTSSTCFQNQHVELMPRICARKLRGPQGGASILGTAGVEVQEVQHCPVSSRLPRLMHSSVSHFRLD